MLHASGSAGPSILADNLHFGLYGRLDLISPFVVLGKVPSSLAFSPSLAPCAPLRGLTEKRLTSNGPLPVTG